VAHTIHAVFDGQVLRPDEAAGLETNKRYLLTVEEETGDDPSEREQALHPLTAILALAADLGVTDLAERHDHYARRR
jgi:hypothetical protein